MISCAPYSPILKDGSFDALLKRQISEIGGELYQLNLLLKRRSLKPPAIRKAS